MGIVYGINAVAEALEAGGARVEKIFVERGQENPRIIRIIETGRRNKVPVLYEEKAWLDRKAGGRRHQGIACHVAETATFSPEEILEAAESPGLLLVLDGVEDPGNLGAILRSAEVAGADGVFLPRRRTAGLGPAAVKASAGAASHVRVAQVPNLARLMEFLQQKGYWAAGLDVSGGPLWEADFTVPTVIVVGGEGKGLHRLVKEKCDFLVSIPMRGKVSSYNASVAAGIALYEILRQRQARIPPPV